MTNLRRRRGRVIAWALGLLLAAIIYSAAENTRPEHKEKADANRILSPWDTSVAPPQCVGREKVRIQPPPAKPPAKQTRQAKAK